MRNQAGRESASTIGLDNHSEALSIWLDMFRWMAAFEVLLFHARHRLLAPLPLVPHAARSVLFYLITGLSGFGGPAVLVFFVLSGFLVGGSSLRRYRRDRRFSFSEYFVARLSRLWIVLLPAFVLTFLLNELGTRVFIPQTGGAGELGNLDQGVTTFLCNALFLQTAACPQYGGNGALWSLFNEFWYYAAWPPIMLAIWSSSTALVRLVLFSVPLLALSLLSLVQFVGPNVAVYFSLWLLGVVAADRRQPLIAMHPAIAACILAGVLIVWRALSRSEVQGTNLLYEYPFDLVVTICTANLIMTMRAKRGLSYPPLRWLHPKMASFSFSLYCIHVPILNCFCALLLWKIGTGWHMTPVGWLPFGLYGIATLLCLLIAYLFSLVTERFTPQLRDALLSRPRRFSGAD